MRARSIVTYTLAGLALAACGGKHGGMNPDAGPADAPALDAPGDGGGDGATADAAASFGLTSVAPGAASRTIDTTLTITGFGIDGTPAIRLTNCDQPGTTYDLTPATTMPTSITTVLAADPARVQGAYTITVTNGDGMIASLTCALKVVAEPPPTVTQVVPSTAWQGDPNDNINSDVTVTIQGTGFVSTPSVRWVSTADPAVGFDAVIESYVSDTQLTAVVPSETQMMPAGTYDVIVTNPDQLSAEWMNGATPGVFTVTATPPPSITTVTPSRIQNSACTTTSMTISGASFQTGATAWYLAPAGTACAGSTTDASGNLLCPMTVGTTMPTAITATLPVCPALGPYPVVVINPDGQSAYWYSIEITPSSDGHLNTGAFEQVTSHLETPRWKHAIAYGFDVYSDSFVYVAGGQDGAGNVLGTVEASQLDLFGEPGPFHHLEQYGGAATPRVSNDLNVPRAGSTLVRVGSSLFSIGGTPQRSDTTTVVPGSKVVERAEILGYDQMPGVMTPTAVPMSQGLPVGSWYYRVSAIGPWGESLPTREVIALNKGGQIQVCWVAPTAMGATSYNIYRSLASDGRADTAAAIAYEVAPASNCFTDTGTGKLAPAPGNLRGSLAAGGTQPAGTYSYRVSAVVPLSGGGTWETDAGYVGSATIAASDVMAGNQTVHVAWDAVPVTGVTYRLYRLDPASGNYELLSGASALTTTSFDDGGVAFDAGGATPVTEVLPLPPGSLSKWDDATPPQLGTAREGLDGVVVEMDPATSNHLVARILVAGGRDGTGGTYAYHTTAESLGVYDDGHTDAAWTPETPTFTHARAYYALLTTQDRNVTPFPPPPVPPPCVMNCGGGIIQRAIDNGRWLLRATAYAGMSLGSPAAPGRADDVTGTEPVYVVAVLGDDAYSASANTGRSDFEACPVDMTTGHLEPDCGVAGGSTWIVQSNGVPNGSGSFGMDAVLYFSYLYPFYGVSSETLSATGTTIQIANSAIARFPLVPDLTMVMGGQIFDKFQSASTSFVVPRAYYQMTRLLAYVYVIGGYTATGPTDEVERHQQ